VLNGSVWSRPRWALSFSVLSRPGSGPVWLRPRWALSVFYGFVVVVAAACACGLVGSCAALGACD
jgi:hypothetical protein